MSAGSWEGPSFADTSAREILFAAQLPKLAPRNHGGDAARDLQDGAAWPDACVTGGSRTPSARFLSKGTSETPVVMFDIVSLGHLVKGPFCVFFFLSAGPAWNESWALGQTPPPRFLA